MYFLSKNTRIHWNECKSNNFSPAPLLWLAGNNTGWKWPFLCFFQMFDEEMTQLIVKSYVIVKIVFISFMFAHEFQRCIKRIFRTSYKILYQPIWITPHTKLHSWMEANSYFTNKYSSSAYGHSNEHISANL